MRPTLANVYIYPIKSTAPFALTEAVVEPRGLAHDRRWLVVDEAGRFLTARQVPRLTLLRATPVADGLALTAPNMPSLSFAPPNERSDDVVIWNDTVRATIADDSVNAALSRFLDRPVKLVYMPSTTSRPVDSEYSQADDEVSFADAYPLLLITQAAVDFLNTKLAAPVSPLRFRPNLIVAGTEPHAEDRWKRVRIGEVEFDVVKPCVRCVLTTVDFERGEFDPSGEPLRTLIGYRRGERGVTFGQNLIPRSGGRVAVGNTVEVLA